MWPLLFRLVRLHFHSSWQIAVPLFLTKLSLEWSETAWPLSLRWQWYSVPAWMKQFAPLCLPRKGCWNGCVCILPAYNWKHRVVYILNSVILPDTVYTVGGRIPTIPYTATALLQLAFLEKQQWHRNKQKSPPKMETQSVALTEPCPGDSERSNDMEPLGPCPIKDSNPTFHLAAYSFLRKENKTCNQFPLTLGKLGGKGLRVNQT